MPHSTQGRQHLSEPWLRIRRRCVSAWNATIKSCLWIAGYGAVISAGRSTTLLQEVRSEYQAPGVFQEGSTTEVAMLQVVSLVLWLSHAFAFCDARVQCECPCDGCWERCFDCVVYRYWVVASTLPWQAAPEGRADPRDPTLMSIMSCASLG